MIVKIFFIIMIIAIFAALMSAAFFLTKDSGRTDRVVRSLTWRIGLSVALFILLFVAYGFGLIKPHGLM